jgi:lipoate-protein ligase A
VSVCRVAGPAVVLGSTQDGSVVDPLRADRSGLSIARRRSGGGAVLVQPGDPVWIDAWVPREDPLWDDDIARAFDWFGAAWVGGLRTLGYVGLSSHRGGYSARTRWSSRICFGGLGAGEVVHEDGRKVVGISQRRTRAGAWFHSAAPLTWAPERLLDVLDLSPAARSAAAGELAAVVAGVDDLPRLAGSVSATGAMVEAAVLAALPPLG